MKINRRRRNREQAVIEPVREEKLAFLLLWESPWPALPSPRFPVVCHWGWIVHKELGGKKLKQNDESCKLYLLIWKTEQWDWIKDISGQRLDLWLVWGKKGLYNNPILRNLIWEHLNLVDIYIRDLLFILQNTSFGKDFQQDIFNGIFFLCIHMWLRNKKSNNFSKLYLLHKSVCANNHIQIVSSQLFDFKLIQYNN